MTTTSATTPQELSSRQKQFLSGADIVKQKVQSVIKQGDIKTISKLPKLSVTLREHQELAKERGRYYVDGVWPEVNKSSDDVKKFAMTFQTSYEQVIKDVENHDEPEIVEKFRSIETLEQLEEDVIVMKTRALEIAQAIKTFSTGFEAVYKQFINDYAEVKKVTSENNDKLKKLNEEKEKLENEASSLRERIFLPFGEIEYKQIEEKIHDIDGKISEVNGDVGSLNTVETQLKSLANNTQTIVSLSENVSEGWISIAASMTEVIGQIKSISPNEAVILIKVKFGATNRDWGDVLKQTQ